MSKQMGRPIKLNKKIVEIIAAALSNGLTRETASRYAHITYKTFLNWYHRGETENERIQNNEEELEPGAAKREKIFLTFYTEINDAELEALIGWQRTINLAAKSDPVWANRMLMLRDPKGYRSDTNTGQEENQASEDEKPYELPIGVIAPSFINAYDDLHDHIHTEYLFYGGRGSTKSSFISLALIWLLKNNPTIHFLAMRQVKDTLRDSVYSQIQWAIDELGFENEFKCTTSPLEITYLKTGQKIYFRGADEPGKIKSLKPIFGYIGAVWFEELDQFHGEEAIRKIEQSAIRGGDIAYIFKSFNPPRTANNWANKYVKIPKATQFRHESTYLQLGSRIKWLGKPFVEEAEHLKAVNPLAYEHEYLGIPNGTGGMVFENVQLRKITDEEIAQFDRVLHGLDFGYFPDPAAYARCHYDAARLTLYIFGEFRGNKLSNRNLYKEIKDKGGYDPEYMLIADSAEPKSIADLREYGAKLIRGAEKGPDSVDYSMKWLQSLAAIVIDNERCPGTADEFLSYELEQDRDGNFISAYPDYNNHSIDAVRYATNLIWRKRGQ